MDIKQLARDLRPFLLRMIEDVQQSASNTLRTHDLSSNIHTGILRDDQAPQFAMLDGSRTMTGDLLLASGKTVDGVDVDVFRADYVAHAANPNAHHTAFVGLRDDANTAIAPDGAGYLKIVAGAGLTNLAGTNQLTLSLINGGGLVVNADSVAVGAGAGLTVNTGNVALTTPGALSVSSTNTSTGNHTHAVTASSAPGAAASLLATSATGGLTLDTSLFVVDAANDRIGMGRTPAATGALLQAQGILDLFVGAETQPRVRADPAAGFGLGSGSVIPDAWITRTATKQGKWYDGTGGGAADFAITGKVVAGSEVFTSPAIATFRSQTEALRLEYDAANYASLKVSGGGNLEIVPTGDVVFNPTGNDILPLNNYDLNLGAINKKYLTIHAAELWVETLVAQDTIATIGGRIMVGPTTTLTTDISSGATTITTKHNQMRANDVAYMEANGKVEFMQIVSGPTGTAGNYSYVVTRNLDGTGANAWNGGDALFNTGTAGSGFIDLYSLHGVNGHLLDYIYNYDAGSATTPFESGTYSANYAQETSWSLWEYGAQINDAVYYGLAGGTWNSLYLNITTAAVGGYGISVWEYWNGTGWTTFTPTSIGSPAAGGGVSREWALPLTGWAAKTINGVSSFWVRQRFTTNSTLTTNARQGQRRVQWRARTYGPTIAMNVRNSTTFNDWDARTVLGNLNGQYDYGNDVYGFAAGQYSTTWLSADETNGVRIMNGTATKARWFTNGNILIGEQATGQANLLLSAGRVQLRNNTTDVITLASTAAADGTIATFEGAIGFGVSGGLWNGSSGSFGGPTTGYKQYRSATGKGLWETWSGGVKQVYLDDNMKLYGGGGDIWLDALGLNLKATKTSRATSETNNITWLGPTSLPVSSLFSFNDGTYFPSRQMLQINHGYASGANAVNNAAIINIRANTPAVSNTFSQIDMGTFWGGSTFAGITITADSSSTNISLNAAKTIAAGTVQAGTASIGTYSGGQASFGIYNNAFPSVIAGTADTIINANSTAGNLYFQTGGSTRARLNSNGDLIANGALYIAGQTGTYITNATMGAFTGTYSNSGFVTPGAVVAQNWFRSYGATGWYSQDFGGGIYCDNSTNYLTGNWIKTYAEVPLYINTGALATTTGSVKEITVFRGASGNDVRLNLRSYRTTAGSDWQTHAMVLRRFTDATGQGFISFLGDNIGIGTFDPVYRLELPNVANSSGQGRANSWVTYSSRRWKTDITPIEDSSELVAHLQGVYYFAATEPTTRRDIGLIAEDVGAVVPELVDWEDDGLYAKSLKYDRIVALLINDNNSMRQRIQALEEKCQ